MDESLFPDNDEPEERPQDNRCNPDKLLDFIGELGRMPTLKECKQRFGGILGPLVASWELDEQGRWPGRRR